MELRILEYCKFAFSFCENKLCWDVVLFGFNDTQTMRSCNIIFVQNGADFDLLVNKTCQFPMHLVFHAVDY